MNQVNKSIQTFRSKLHSGEYQFLWNVLLSVFLLMFMTTLSFIWAIFAVCALFLIGKPNYTTLLTILLSAVSFLILKFTSNTSFFESLNISDHFRSKTQSYLASGPTYYRTYGPLMLLGVKTSESKEIYNLSLRINVVHLFVISGFHISLFYVVISRLLSFLGLPKNFASLAPMVLIFIYLYLLNFSVSALRATLVTLFLQVNKVFLHKKFKNIDILSFTMLVLIVINPAQVSGYSFVLTFIATFAIVIANEIKWKTKTKKYYGTILMVYFSTLPIIVSLNSFISPLGIIFGTILTPVFIFFYTCSLFLFPFKEVMDKLYLIFDWILRSINEVNFLIPIHFIESDNLKFIYLITPAYLIIDKTWFLFTVKKNI